MNKKQKLYLKFRKLGYSPSQALRAAKITMKWHLAESRGRVGLDILPDTDVSFDNLTGDCFNPKYNLGISATNLKRQEKAFLDKVNNDGVWGIVGYAYVGKYGTRKDIDSCWGFVGDDWRNSGYDLDIMQATLEAAGYKV